MVERRYAAALIDMADESGLSAAIDKDMTELGAMMASSGDLDRLASSPLIPRYRQEQGFLAIAEKAGFQKLTKNFIGILARNRRLPQLSGIIAAFKNELARRRGEMEAKIKTAAALTPAQTKQLQDSLSQAMGSHVTLNVEVDRDLLGGMTITVGSRLIDDSVRGKLDRLRRAMTEGGKAA